MAIVAAAFLLWVAGSQAGENSDRSKAAGRMITIDPSDPNWEDKLSDRLNQSPRSAFASLILI